MSDYGIKISIEGYTIDDPLILTGDGVSYPDPTPLRYNSNWFVFKIIGSGSFSTDVPSSAGTHRLDYVNINHSLGYVPAVQMYWSVDAGVTYWSSNAESEGTATPLRTLLAQATSTQITAEIFTIDLPAYTLSGRYFIFADVGSV